MTGCLNQLKNCLRKFPVFNICHIEIMKYLKVPPQIFWGAYDVPNKPQARDK